MAADRKDPRALAVAAADAWVGSVVSGLEAFTPGSVFAVDVAELVDGVARALEADRVRRHGPINDVDRRDEELAFAREAGYLIGVQIGLRLRSGKR